MQFLNFEHMQERKEHILEEFSRPHLIYNNFSVHHTVVFFGSARSFSSESLAKANNIPQKEKSKLEKMTLYHDQATELAYKMSLYSKQIQDETKRFYICSGGGGGIMRAANKGAKQAGMPSIGLNIQLPHEQDPNPYQTKEISFNFHYFFIRKYWFAFLAKALVVFPGGFGTMDELFEILTLVQTHKMPLAPIILYGREFWEQVFNFDLLYEWGLISEEDKQLYSICDTVDEAFALLQKTL